MKPTSTQNPSRPHRFNRLQRLQALLFALILMLSSLGLPVIAEETPEEQAVQEAAAPNVYGVVVVGELEEKQLTADLGGDSQISVLYGKNANIPDGAELRVSPIADASAYEEQAKKDLNVKSVDFVQLFDMGIYYDGVKIEPAEKVKIRFRLTEDMKREGDLRIVHFPTDPVPATQEPEPAPVPAAAPKKLMAVKGAKAAPTAVEPQSEDDDDDLMPVQAASVDMPITEELTPVLEDENMVSFETYSFSVFGVCYTVDFYYGEYEYHMDGGGVMLLSELFELLEIDRSVADVTNVAFSDPELLSVERTEDGGDWTLTSLQAFDTIESLTIEFANGDRIVVRVEDAQSYVVTFNVNDPVAGSVYVLSTIYGSEITLNVRDDKTAERSVRPRSADEPTNGHLSATRGYNFVGWLENGSTPCGYGELNPSNYADLHYIQPTGIEHAKTYTACFKPANQYLITFDKNISSINGASGTVSQADARSFRYIVQSGNYDTTDEAFFCYSGDGHGAYAQPAAGSKFTGWYYGDELLCTDQWFTVPDGISGDKIATARFAPANTVTVTYKSVDVSNNNSNINRIKVNDGRTYSGENAQGVPYQDTETVYENGIPHGATSVNTTTGAAFVGWRDGQTGKLLTRDATLTLSEWAGSDRMYTAEYVKEEDRILFLAKDGHGQIYKGAVSENQERTDLVDGYQINNNTIDLKRSYHVVPEPGFVFDHWEFNGETLDGIGEEIKTFSKSTNGTKLQVLTAVFKPICTVTYDTSVIQQVGNNDPGWQHWVDVPWCYNNISLVRSGTVPAQTGTDTFTETVAYGGSFTLPDLNQTTRVTQTNNGYNLLTHTFKGWKMEFNGQIVKDSSGNEIIYPAGTTFTAYDPCKFIAVWDAYFPEKTRNNSNASSERDYRFNTNTCGFFLRLFDSSFDKGNTNTYTDCLYTSRLFIGGNSGNFATNPNTNGARADFYGNSDETNKANIDAIDSGIRTIGNGWLQSDQSYTQNQYAAFEGAKLQLEGAFPSNDFIFSRLRAWNADIAVSDPSRRIQINGHQIPQDMLTSDYFEIKWYVLKDQENSWHIDGMLIPKYAKLRATKQFIGPTAALDSAKNGYAITVQETSPRTGYSADSHVLTMGYNGSTGAVTWTYTMNGTNISRTSGEDGSTWTFKDASGSLLARVSSDIGGNNISWSLHRLTPMTAYTVTESGYDATGYTAITNYTIENTPQSSGLTGNTATASVERVYNYPDYMSETSYQTVAFTNIYTLPYVMTIMKQDGTTLHGLSNVFFDFVMKDGNNQTVYSEVCHSDANGQISIHFDHGLFGDFTFTLDEQPYDGYQALATVRGNVNIDNQGKVTLSDVQTTINGVNTTITPDANDPSIIYLINHPERKRVVVNKIWTNNSDARPVTMQLLRNGVPMSGMYVVLGASEATAQGVTPVKVTGWTYTWNDLPAYVDGTEVIYTAREEWIGEPGGVDSIHYNTGNDSDGYLEYIVNQSQTVTTVTEGENTVTIVNVRVENTRDNGQIMFSKVDTGKKAVNGAVFAVFRGPDPDPGYNQGPPPLDTPCVKKLDGTDATYTSVNGVVTIDNLEHHPNADNWYWLREISTPAGYEDHSNYWYRLNIKENNSRMYDYGVNGELFSLSQNVDSVENKPFTANVKVIKTGTNNAALSGAVFSLHRSFLDVVMVPAPIRGYEALTTNSSGELAYANGTPIIFTLEEGVYFLKEESAPAGYIPLQNPIKLEIRDTARPEYSNVLTATIQNDPLSVTTDGNNQVLTVPNTPGVELPSTGGPGTAAYLAVGLALMALALILTRLRKRVQA